jgi:hypothetical protein
MWLQNQAEPQLFCTSAAMRLVQHCIRRLHLLNMWKNVSGKSCSHLHIPTSSAIPQLKNKFLRFYEARRFITVFTKSNIQSYHKPVPSNPYPISLGTILILSSQLRMGLWNCLFPPGFPTVSMPSSLHACYVPCQSNPCSH